MHTSIATCGRVGARRPAIVSLQSSGTSIGTAAKGARCSTHGARCSTRRVRRSTRVREPTAFGPPGWGAVRTVADSCGAATVRRADLTQVAVPPPFGTEAEEMRTVRTIFYPLQLKCVFEPLIHANSYVEAPRACLAPRSAEVIPTQVSPGASATAPDRLVGNLPVRWRWLSPCEFRYASPARIISFDRQPASTPFEMP